MTHVMVLLWAVAFGLGITAITSTYYRYRLEPLKLLRHYWQFLILSNVTVGGALVMTYVATNIGGLEVLAARRSAAALFLVSSFWVVAAFVYKLVDLTLDLLGRDVSVRVRYPLVSVLAAAPIGFLAGLALADGDVSDERVFAYSEILNVSLVAAGVMAMVGSLAAAGALVPAGYRIAVRRMCSLHLVAFVLILVATLLNYPSTWYLLILSFVTINLTPLVLLGPLLAQRRTSPLVDPGRGGALEAFASRHGISERELEIVRLLLNGCTNSDIGNALCISSHTVKNHVYNVYRKVGVRNRVQLANLVRDL
jgi:DNA-binding CsgD family transcriptional regulator